MRELAVSFISLCCFLLHFLKLASTLFTHKHSLYMQKIDSGLSVLSQNGYGAARGFENVTSAVRTGLLFWILCYVTSFNSRSEKKKGTLYPKKLYLGIN